MYRVRGGPCIRAIAVNVCVDKSHLTPCMKCIIIFYVHWNCNVTSLNDKLQPVLSARNDLDLRFLDFQITQPVTLSWKMSLLAANFARFSVLKTKVTSPYRTHVGLPMTEWWQSLMLPLGKSMINVCTESPESETLSVSVSLFQTTRC